MAPKRINTGKRKQGESSVSQPPPQNQSYDQEKFRSRYHQNRYNALLKQTMWLERVVKIKPEGPYGHFHKLFLDQGWTRLLNPIVKINAELVREFYANALPQNPQTDPFTFETFVRGRQIKFDRDAINTFLGNPFDLDVEAEDGIDDFHKKQNLGHFLLEDTYDEIKKFVMLEGKTYDKSDAGREHIAQYKLMKPPAKLIFRFILHNVKPNSHMADCTIDVCPLIYYILKGIKVDIARTIAWELKKVVLQGHGEPKTRLSFPGLIMGLIKDTHMRMPSDYHEIIKNPIDDAFITRYIMGQSKKDKGKGKQASSSRAPPSQSEPQDAPFPFPPAAGFDFASYVQWQHENNVLNYNMMSAIHRENLYFQQSQYIMQQQHGYPPEIMDQFMAPPAFQEYVNWPEDTPKPFGGGEDFRGQDDANMEDIGGLGDDDPANVPSATSTPHGSDDDDMQS
jgi:hypothetical protein